MQQCVRHLPRCTTRPIRRPLRLAIKAPGAIQRAPPVPARHRLYSTTTTISAADLTFGQAVHETHPHLLKAGELTPGITAQEYYDRRNALASQLPRDSIAVLASSTLKYKTRDVFYPYAQDPDFLYLTGFLEPDSLAIIVPSENKNDNDHTFHLYVRSKNPEEETWEGPRSGTQAALDIFNADHSSDIQTSAPSIHALLRSSKTIYTDITPSQISPSNTLLQSLISPLTTLKTSSLTALLAPLRLLKSPAELSLLRQIGRLSGRAFTSTMSLPHDSEHAVSTHLHTALSCSNLTPAYIPVIAGDDRARTIHYTANNALLQPDSSILVDAGGELGGYVTDITRVWPNSGRFTAAQRDLYTAILSVQRECISLCRANAGHSLDTLHTHATALLRSQLSDLGFPVSSSKWLSGGGERDANMGVLFPHHLSHYVGLTVHDTPSISRRRKLEEGMVVTIEPGVYVPDREDMPKAFRGMGIRIEDTVAIGAEGPTVLSVEAIKEVDDIEALRS